MPLQQEEDMEIYDSIHAEIASRKIPYPDFKNFPAEKLCDFIWNNSPYLRKHAPSDFRQLMPLERSRPALVEWAMEIFHELIQELKRSVEANPSLTTFIKSAESDAEGN